MSTTPCSNSMSAVIERRSTTFAGHEMAGRETRPTWCCKPFLKF